MLYTIQLQGSSNEEAAERAAAEMASLNTIELTTKRCPQCNVHTEKNGNSLVIVLVNFAERLG